MRGFPRLRRLHYLLGVLLLGTLAATAIEVKTYYARDLLIESIYGSKPHRVPCGRWPTPDEVRQVLDEHAEVVSRIESINPGYTVVNANVLSCPGRADIRILYATASDRRAIKSLLGDGKYFFGVPYQMRNT